MIRKITVLSMLLISLFSYSQGVIYTEDFEDATIPSGWATIDMPGGNGPHDWTFGSGNMPAGDNFDTNAAIFNDGSDVHDFKLLYYSQGLDLSQHKNITLSFDYAIQAFVDKGQLIFYIYDNANDNYIAAQVFDTDTNPTNFSFDVDAFLAAHTTVDAANFIFGFAWDDENEVNSWGAGVDNVKITGVPVNDACSDAISFSNLPYTNTQLLDGTTNNDGFIEVSGCGYGMNDGVWYKFTPVYSGHVMVTENCYGFDSELGIYSGTCDNLSCVGNADDGWSAGAPETVEFDAVAGEEYLINIGYWSSSTDHEEKGQMVIQVEYVVLNDEASGAFNVNVAPQNSTPSVYTTASNVGATDSSAINGTITDPDAHFNGGDVWFKFTAPASGSVDVVVPVQGDWSSFVHYLYDSAASTTPLQHQINANVNDVNNIPSSVHYDNLTAGQVYYMRAFDDQNNNIGEVQFYVIEAASQSVEDYAALNFTYYPNPAKEVIYLQSKDEINAISLTNLLGQEVKNLKPQKTQVKLNLNGLENGVYFMKVSTGGKTQMIKIIKK